MAGRSLRHGLAVFEIATGLICISISAYYLVEFQVCLPDAALCQSLAMLPVVLLLVPGILMLGAGTVSIRKETLALWKIQLWMVALAGLYFLLVIVWLNTLSE